MFHKPFHQLKEADLVQAVVDQIREGKNLDYKQTLPGPTPRDKVHFLIDVSAMANADGGIILYGIEELRDEEGKSTGVPISIPGIPNLNSDQEILRLQNLLRSGIKPRIQGVDFRPIPLANGNTVLAVKVPRSWNIPHVVEYENHWRFYTRGPAGNHPMDVDEVRVAMKQADTITRRLHEFRLERLAKISALETPAELPSGPKVVLHILPLTLGDPRWNLDITELARREDVWTRLFPLYGGGGYRRINVDGLLLYNEVGYAQLFRSGAIESVDASLILPKQLNPELPPYIPSVDFEETLLRGTRNYLSLLQAIEIASPLYVSLSLLEVRGYRLATPNTYWRYSGMAIDRSDLILPEVVVEDISTSPETILRPLIDMVWNAGGYRCSPNFDENGQWKPKRQY